MKKLSRITLITSALLLAFSGCNSGEDDLVTNLRFYNAVPDAASIDFSLDFEPYFERVGYLEGSSYFEIDAEQHNLQATVTNSFTALADSTTTFQDDQDYTLLVFGLSDNASSLLLRDDNEPAGDDTAKIRLVHTAQASRSVDVYIHAPTVDISSISPTEETLTYREVSNYLASQSGSYLITVTSRDSKEILAQSSTQTLEGEGVYTILIADSVGGVTPPQIVVLKDR